MGHFLADVGVNIQSIRRVCRKLGIKVLPLPLEDDEQAPDRQPGKSAAKRAKLLSLLRRAASPWSLCGLCRSVVRRRLGRRIKFVKELGIPDTLKDYVTFKYDYSS